MLLLTTPRTSGSHRVLNRRFTQLPKSILNMGEEQKTTRQAQGLRIPTVTVIHWNEAKSHPFTHRDLVNPVHE